MTSCLYQYVLSFVDWTTVSLDVSVFCIFYGLISNLSIVNFENNWQGMRLQYFPMIATRTFSKDPGCKTRQWPRKKHSSKIVINTCPLITVKTHANVIYCQRWGVLDRSNILKKMKKRTYDTVGKVSKSNKEIVVRDKINTSSKQLHVRLLSYLDRYIQLKVVNWGMNVLHWLEMSGFLLVFFQKRKTENKNNNKTKTKQNKNKQKSDRNKQSKSKTHKQKQTYEPMKTNPTKLRENKTRQTKQSKIKLKTRTRGRG